MPMPKLLTVTLGAAFLTLAPHHAQAQVFGSLGNFDVVNTTGHTAYGFEIDIEDSSYDHTKITSVFGLDRVFSFVSPDPGAVVRYGKPIVQDLPGIGVRIVYGGDVASGNFTPSQPFTTTGESCWPGANPNWKSTSCDHFGVSTWGNPAKTTYSWLVDSGGGALTKQVVGVPSVTFTPTYQPPAPPPPPGVPVVPPPLKNVVAAIQAQDLGQGNMDNAFWVKIVKTTLDDNVDLNDLLGGNHPGARPEIAGLNSETEIEWQPLQIGKADEVTPSVDTPKASVVYRFQFYKYVGTHDDEWIVDPQPGDFPLVDGDGVAYVNVGGVRQNLDFIGQQIAGFNAYEVAAVPEPQTWALMLGGVAMTGWMARRRRR